MELVNIIDNYTEMSSIQLLGLVDDLPQVKESEIPFLRSELNNRNEQESVLKIDAFLNREKLLNSNSSEKEVPKNDSENEIKKVEILNFIFKQFYLKKNDDCVNNELIDKELKSQFNLSDFDVLYYRQELAKLGKKKFTLGIILLFVSIVATAVYGFIVYKLFLRGGFSIYYAYCLALIYLYVKTGILIFKGRLVSKVK